MLIVYVAVIMVVLVFVVYPILAFGVAPFIIPNLRRIRYQEISPDMKNELDKILGKNGNKKTILREIFYLVANHCDSGTMMQFKSPGKLFLKKVGRVWKMKCAHSCNVQNMVLANMLVASQYFTKNDIDLKTTNIFVNIHKYLRVRVDENEYVNLDPWGYCFGIPFGRYTHGFPFNLKRKQN